MYHKEGKMKKALAIFLALFLLIALVGCNNVVEFNVNFVVDGEVYSTVGTSGEEIIKIPTNPTKDGYTFGGWYWDEGSWTQPFTANSLLNAPLSSDMSVYAKWNKVEDTTVQPPAVGSTDIASASLTVGGDTIRGSVSNETETFSFLNDIVVSDRASYVVSRDIYGSDVVATKTVALVIGDNTFYILVTAGNDMKLYTVTIRRLPMYTVSFATCGGSHVDDQIIEEGCLALVPTTPIRAGYAFTGWSYDFTQPIMADTEIKANWQANTNTKYTVEYYLQNTDKLGYDKVETITLSGTTDTTATAEKKPFDHFTFNSTRSDITGNINGDGSLVLKVYYTRNSYEISVTNTNTKGGSITAPHMYTNSQPYDKEITLIASVKPGYTFLGYFIDEDKVCGELQYTFKVAGTTSITAEFEANKDTKYTVEYYHQNVTQTGYDKVETVKLEGTTDTTATAEQKPFTHFTFNENMSTMSGNIDGEGKLVLKVYYTRDEYTVSANVASAGTVSGTGTYPYGTKVSISSSAPYLGYKYNGVLAGQKKLTVDTVWTGEIDSDIVISFSILPEMQNFVFASTATACEITGIIDKTVKNITVPDYVTSIGSSAFEGCTSLTSVTIPDSVTSIGNKAFYACYKLVEVINKSNRYILAGSSNNGYVAYYAKEVHTGDSKIVNVNDYLFYTYDGANYLLGYVGDDIELVLPGNYNGQNYEIYEYAFYDCDGLTSVTIGNSVTSIGFRAFYDCDSLTSVTIGNSITGIGSSAFEDCTSLTSVTIPDSVTSIGSSAFYNCYKLVEVINKSSLYMHQYTSSYGYVAYYAIEVHTGESKIVNVNDYLFYTYNGVNYLLGYVGDDTELVLPDNYNGQNYKINEYAFYECSSLTSITIPDSVTSIGSSAFYGCSSLESITVPDSVTSIGASAFYGCSSLKSITLPFVGSSKNTSSNTHFGYIFGASSYSDNSSFVPESLKTVVVTGGTSIGSDAFCNCKGLTGITIPDSVTSIGDDAFFGCTGLTSITIPNSVTSIGDWAFSSCAGLTSITIPNSVTSIGDWAFYNCTGLTSATIGNGVTSIGGSAFYGCRILSVVYCEAASKPSGWDLNWNTSGCRVVWGYKGA